MNTKTQKAIVIAVAFFLVGTILNIDYAMWNEETHNEYQRYMQNIIEGNISVAIPVTKEQFEEYAREEGNYTFYYLRVGKSFEEWKHDNGKSYWTDLTKRLRVVAVSAYGEPADINQSFEDYLKWIEEHEKSRDTPILLTLDDMWAMAQSKSTYKEEVNGTTYYYIRLTREQMEYIKTHPEDFNVSWYYATLPLEEPKITSVTNTTEDDLVYNVDGGVGIELSYPFYRGKYVGNNAQIDRESDEEFTGEVEEEYPTVLEVNITPQDAPIINPCNDWNYTNWDCDYNESTGRVWFSYHCYCGCGESNCSGDPEGCEPEEPQQTFLDKMIKGLYKLLGVKL